MDYKLEKVEDAKNPKKKLQAIFINKNTGKKKTVQFGASGMDDYTLTKDKAQREAYRKRHAKDLKTKDPLRAGYLSYYILWGDSVSRKKNIKSYKEKFNL